MSSVVAVIVFAATAFAQAPMGSCCITNCTGFGGVTETACGQRFTEAECDAVATAPYVGPVAGCRGQWTEAGQCGVQGSACYPEGGTSFACAGTFFFASSESCVVTQKFGCREDSIRVVKSTLADCCVDGSTARGPCADDPVPPPPPATPPPPPATPPQTNRVTPAPPTDVVDTPTIPAPTSSASTLRGGGSTILLVGLVVAVAR